MPIEIDEHVKDLNAVLSEPKHIDCPFCDDKGFSKLGLKIHLINNRCESYNKIDAPDFSKEPPCCVDDATERIQKEQQ